MLARVEPSIRKESPRLSTECSALRERRLLARTISTLNISYRIKLMRTDALQILEQPQERKPYWRRSEYSYVSRIKRPRSGSWGGDSPGPVRQLAPKHLDIWIWRIVPEQAATASYPGGIPGAPRSSSTSRFSSSGL